MSSVGYFDGCQVIPFFEQPRLELGPVTIHAFGVLTVTAAPLGLLLTKWRLGRLGLDTAAASRMWQLMPLSGFAGAWLARILVYAPGTWSGFSSFWGLVAGLPGQREAAVGRGVIVRGDPEARKLYMRIQAESAAVRMPPAFSNRILSDAERHTLVCWIKEGTKYESHWAYLKPGKVDMPAGPVGVDALVNRRLAAKNLQAVGEAGRRTLIRRLRFDLTGLPPEPARVNAFVNNRDPRAYHKLVDERAGRLRHSRKMIRVCSRELSHPPGRAGDDNASVTCGLRTTERQPGWTTLTGHKWSSFGERRGRKTRPPSGAENWRVDEGGLPTIFQGPSAAPD